MTRTLIKHPILKFLLALAFFWVFVNTVLLCKYNPLNPFECFLEIEDQSECIVR